ncbi:hypothetical protein Hanom_Chr10g00959771 [Helianthus anomalus]
MAPITGLTASNTSLDGLFHTGFFTAVTPPSESSGELTISGTDESGHHSESKIPVCPSIAGEIASDTITGGPLTITQLKLT